MNATPLRSESGRLFALRPEALTGVPARNQMLSRFRAETAGRAAAVQRAHDEVLRLAFATVIDRFAFGVSRRYRRCHVLAVVVAHHKVAVVFSPSSGS